MRSQSDEAACHNAVQDSSGAKFGIAAFGSKSTVAEYERLVTKYVNAKANVVLLIVTPGLGGTTQEDHLTLKSTSLRIKLADDFPQASNSPERSEVFFFVERQLTSGY